MFASLAIVVGTSIYALNKEELKAAKAHPVLQVKNVEVVAVEKKTPKITWLQPKKKSNLNLIIFMSKVMSR